jgi:hypothetical protein
MLVSFENSTHTVHPVKITYCFCPLPSLFYLLKPVELHEDAMTLLFHRSAAAMAQLSIRTPSLCYSTSLLC